jgi:hypothetical protein
MKIEFQGAEYLANFMEGDLFELWRVLNGSVQKYPIIWLQSGYEVEESHNVGNSFMKLKDVNFFIITKGDANDRYQKRFRTTFENQLYPLKDSLISRLKKSNGFTISDSFRHSSFPFNEINDASLGGMKLKPQTTTISDVWDAVYLQISEIKINSNCYQKYLIKNNTKC